jgi:hypothetical protein
MVHWRLQRLEDQKEPSCLDTRRSAACLASVDSDNKIVLGRRIDKECSAIDGVGESRNSERCCNDDKLQNCINENCMNVRPFKMAMAVSTISARFRHTNSHVISRDHEKQAYDGCWKVSGRTTCAVRPDLAVEPRRERPWFSPGSRSATADRKQ